MIELTRVDILFYTHYQHPNRYLISDQLVKLTFGLVPDQHNPQKIPSRRPLSTIMSHTQVHLWS